MTYDLLIQGGRVIEVHMSGGVAGEHGTIDRLCLGDAAHLMQLLSLLDCLHLSVGRRGQRSRRAPPLDI